MTTGENVMGGVYGNYVRAEAEATSAKYDWLLEQGLIALTGEPIPTDWPIHEQAMEVFPSPQEVRTQAKALSSEQMQRLRSPARLVGIGRKETILPSGLLLPGPYRAKLEGGLVWKMAGEAVAACGDPGAIEVTFCASPHVKSTAAEIANLAKLYDAHPGERVGPDTFVPTQYGEAEFLARQLPGFREQETVHPFGYDVTNGYARNAEPGALRTLGFAQDGERQRKPVRLFAIERENYERADGTMGYRNQPDTADVMGLLSDANNGIDGDTQTPAAFFTTPTYPSRELGVARASMLHGRLMVTPTVGADGIAQMKGEEPPATAEAALDKLINQVPGEFYVMAEQAGRLAAALPRAAQA
jgi:hypothetical protein